MPASADTVPRSSPRSPPRTTASTARRPSADTGVIPIVDVNLALDYAVAHAEVAELLMPAWRAAEDAAMDTVRITTRRSTA